MELIRQAAEGLPWSTLAEVDRSSPAVLGGIQLAVAPVYNASSDSDDTEFVRRRVLF